MSDDLTDGVPAYGPEPSTPDLVLQLLERVGRVEEALGIGEPDAQPLSGRVNRRLLELAEFKAETRESLSDVDRELARLARLDAGRYLRIEERVHALEHREETKP